MVIAWICGGLGNQLDTYVCGYSVAKYLHQELVLDVSDYTHRGYFRPYCLDKLQMGPHRKIVYPSTPIDFREENCIPKELLDRGFKIIRHEDYKTREALLDAVKGLDNVYLLGYGGMHYCSDEDRRELRDQIQLKTPSAAVSLFKKAIQSEFSVAVHVRRTDFVRLGSHSSLAYYQAAITYVKLFYPDAHFYFFSDDIQYVKDQFGSCENYHYVHFLGGADADLDEFFCITACNGRVLTQKSSFSYWAAELNQGKNSLNIGEGPDCLDRSSPNRVFLTQAAVDTLSSRYHAVKTVPPQDSTINDSVFRLLSEERNDEAIEAIEAASLDTYGLSEASANELAAFKTIALAQKGEAGLPAALRMFYLQMQKEHENPTFHANYFRALYQSGCIEESAIHAALANRYGDPEDYQSYFAQMAPFAQKLYQLLRNNPARHFIFISREQWNYYTTYIKTLAVLLARMGQKVSFLQPVTGTVEANVDDESIAAYAMQRIKPAGNIYSFHVDLIPNITRQGDASRTFLFHELVRQCVKRFDMPAVVVASHPNVFSEPTVSGVKYVVPDICDPLNREKYFLDEDGIRIENYIGHMANFSDAVFLSGASFTAAKKLYGDKIHQAFAAWEGPAYEIFDADLDFTPNYISSTQMIQNAAALLQV